MVCSYYPALILPAPGGYRLHSRAPSRGPFEAILGVGLTSHDGLLKRIIHTELLSLQISGKESNLKHDGLGVLFWWFFRSIFRAWYHSILPCHSSTT